MSNEFQEKLQLYKEGKLNQEEVIEIEAEIDRFIAISDYLNRDEQDFIEELKQQTPEYIGKEATNAKFLKRRVNLRIIMMTTFAVFSAFVIFIFVYFSASRITSSLFGLNHKEMFVKREIAVQFAQMFQPKYKVQSSSVSSSLFAQQNIRVSLENNLGNTNIDKTEVSVKYSLGKPVNTRTGVVPPLIFEDFIYSTDHEADQISGFKVLEKAPQGTEAKIFVEFSKALSAQQIKDQFINQISNTDTTALDITLFAGVSKELVIANPSYYLFRSAYPYSNNNAESDASKALKQSQYVNMDNEAHKESLIGNLYLIKNNKKLLQAMYYEDLFENINMDDMIKQVENNGAQYVGMYISADSKELLKLKGSTLIHCIRVQNIVIW